VLFSAGTIGGNWQVERPLTLITNDGRVTVPPLKAGKEWCAAFNAELQTAVNAVRQGGGGQSRLLSGELARDALRLCYAEAKSITTGKPVAVA
jgi:predicted dehydrogenase